MIVVKVGGGTSLNIDAVVADIVALRAEGTELLLVHGGAQTTNAGGRGARPSAAVRDQRDRPRQPPHRPAHARDLRDGLLRPAEQDVGREAADARASTPSACRASTAASSKARARTRCASASTAAAWCCATTGPAPSRRSTPTCCRLLIGAGYFPVLTPPGASTAGEAINVDGDRAAAMVAGAFNAEALVILTDMSGC